MSFQRLPRKRGEKVNFFFENLSLVPETREVMEHFKLVFGSGTSDLAKIRPLKIWTSWISPWVPPYGILPRAQYKNSNANRKLEAKARALLALSLSLFPPTPSRSAVAPRVSLFTVRGVLTPTCYTHPTYPARLGSRSALVWNLS